MVSFLGVQICICVQDCFSHDSLPSFQLDTKAHKNK